MTRAWQDQFACPACGNGFRIEDLAQHIDEMARCRDKLWALQQRTLPPSSDQEEALRLKAAMAQIVGATKEELDELRKKIPISDEAYAAAIERGQQKRTRGFRTPSKPKEKEPARLVGKLW